MSGLNGKTITANTPPEFWAATPAYDTWAFWTLVVAQPGERDAYQRELLVIGHGAAGPIRCTREYAYHRQYLGKRRSIGERIAATRRQRKAEEGARIRAIMDKALARATGV